MSDPFTSLFHEHGTVVRARRCPTLPYYGRMPLRKNGLFGSLYTVSARDALALLDRGVVKLPAEVTRKQLQAHIEGLDG